MVEAGPGDTITVNPGEVHDGMPIGDAGRSWRMLYIDPLLVAEVLCDISEGRAADVEFSQPVVSDARIARQFRGLFSALTQERDDPGLRGEERLWALLASIMHQGSVLGSGDGIPQAITLAQSRMDDDPAMPLTLSDLARSCGLSRFQVLRGFARATGLTPHAYLVQRRIQLARRLIAGGAPLAEAALGSGFADQSHMTRIFVRTYGVSPRAYADAIL
jgi:AraC-like DNA-binding protein